MYVCLHVHPCVKDIHLTRLTCGGHGTSSRVSPHLLSNLRQSLFLVCPCCVWCIYKLSSFQKSCLLFLSLLRHPGITDSQPHSTLTWLLGFQLRASGLCSKCFIEPSLWSSLMFVWLVGYIFSFLLTVLILHLKAAHMLDKHSTTELDSWFKAAT